MSSLILLHFQVLKWSRQTLINYAKETGNFNHQCHEKSLSKLIWSIILLYLDFLSLVLSSLLPEWVCEEWGVTVWEWWPFSMCLSTLYLEWLDKPWKEEKKEQICACWRTMRDTRLGTTIIISIHPFNANIVLLVLHLRILTRATWLRLSSKPIALRSSSRTHSTAKRART